MQRKDTPRSAWSPFAAFSRALRETPSPRDASPKDWTRLERLYLEWRAETGEAKRKKAWYEAKGYRLGLLPEAKASPEALALHLYEQHRIVNDRRKRKESGFDARREKRRKAKDPVAYKSAAAKRQREYRARIKAAAEAERDLDRQLQMIEQSEGQSEAPSEAPWEADNQIEDPDPANDLTEIVLDDEEEDAA